MKSDRFTWKKDTVRHNKLGMIREFGENMVLTVTVSDNSGVFQTGLLDP